MGQQRPKLLMPARRRCAVLLVVLCVALLHVPNSSTAAPLTVVNTVNDIWSNVAMQAAEATMKAIQQKTGLKDLSLRDVPLDSFQVYVGRQHHLAVEIGGQQFELTLNNQPLEAAAAGGNNDVPLHTALPMPQDMSSSALAEFKKDPWQWQRQRMMLPEITLAGPVELVFSRITDLSLWLPHSTDVPRARRLLVAPGAALTLRQLKGISLRKPVELPDLPPSYVAEVYAHMKLGEAEPGFENAPGMLFLAGELYRAATNASLGLGDEAGRTKQLLSFEIEPAGSSVTILAARQPGDQQAPKLKLKKQPDGTLELSLRESDEAAAASAAAAAAAQPGGVAPGALQQKIWAWPLPLVDLQDWVPYETLLRSILAAQPLQALQKELQKGVALRLTKSSVSGVQLVHFDMELAGPVSGDSPAVMPADMLLDMDRVEGGSDTLELWEAVVEIREKPDGSGDVDFVPVSVKRKHAYHSTLTLSPSALALAMGRGNQTSPLGTESHDLGLARNAQQRDEL